MIKIFRYFSIQFTFFLVLGILLGFYINFNPTQFSYVLLVCLVILFIANYLTSKILKPTFYFNLLVYLVVFFLGIFLITIQTDNSKNNHYSNFLADTNKATIKIDKILKTGNYYYKYEAKVKNLNTNITKGRILVNIKKDSLKKDINVDDELFVNTDFNELLDPKNPYSFNYKAYLKKQNILHQITIDSTDYFLLKSHHKTLKGVAHQIRKKVNIALINNHFKDDELAIINAILLGQRQDISEDLRDSYASAGAIHILAISGLHIGIILLILNSILKPLERISNGKLIKTILIVIFLWTFGIIAGLSASVVRAVTMFTAVAIGMHLKRPANIFNTLFSSIFVLLLFNPFYLFDVGFQLSYLAVFSIVIFQPQFYSLWKPKLKLVDYFWKLFTVSLAAQIGVLPISFYYFHQFPSLFFISNLVIIPFLGLILMLGILVIILSVSNLLPTFLMQLYSYIIYTMNAFITWISNQESFLIKNISFSSYKMIATYLIIMLLIYFLIDKNYKKLKYILVGIIVLQLVYLFEKHQLETTSEFIVFQKSRNTILGNRNGREVTFYHDLDTLNFKNNKIIQNYIVGSAIENIKQKPIMNMIFFRNDKILVVDSLGVYNLKNSTPQLLILTQSPKINMQRLLDSIHPKIIIADGSNYKSYINLWQQTCVKNKTPFYATAQKGAFILK